MMPAWSTKRRLVPRWRSVEQTAKAGELSSIRQKNIESGPRSYSEELKDRLALWRREPGLISAAELLESAIVEGDEGVAVGAARRLLFSDPNAAPLIKQQAAQVLRRTGHGNELPEVPAGEARSPIALWRARTRLHPHDPLAWTELSLHHTIYGHHDSAKRAMTVALQLAGDNRHVLRSGSRLYLHLGDPERAHDLILRSPATAADPWLLAAELSLAELASRSPRLIRAARQVQNSGLLPRTITELAGALATLELVDGSSKSAKKLFAQSMRDPTGNALAQAEWAIPFGANIGPTPRFTSVQEAGEASAFRSYLERRYDDAVSACDLWASEEPYSIRPFEFGSAVAGYIGSYEVAITLATRGLGIRPGAPKLVNALAFALGSASKLDEAEVAISRMSPQADEYSKNVAIANRGLIAFRRGDEEQARSLYREAISAFQRMGNRQAQATARIYQAREALIAGSKDANILVEEARKSWKQYDSQGTHLMLADIDARLSSPKTETAPVSVERADENVLASRGHERAPAFSGATWSIAMKIGRNAGSGKFTTVTQAQAKPKTHVVETVKPGPKGK